MANQPKKYTKFVATAATATLVASAIVPVASASFTDVSATNSHAANIDALVEAKIIGGYADGTFKPNQELTRGQVVKMLGKWVEAQGFTIPADYATVARFTDVAVDAKDQELVKYAALVKDVGVFNGSNGALNAAGTITRENMAVTLDRAFKAVNGTSLVELAADIEDVKVADLATAKAEARTAVQALRDLGISGVENFNPKAAVTRGQFASFLNKTINVEAPKAVELTLTSAVATSATTLDVVLSDESKHVVTLPTALEANKATEVKFTIGEKEYTSTVTYVLEVKAATVVDATTLEVVLTDDTKHTVKLEEALEANKATAVTFKINGVDFKATVTHVVNDLAVSSVKAINATKIEVKFNKEVLESEVETAGTYVIAGATASTYELQEDGKTVIVTLTSAIANDTTVAVTVNPVTSKVVASEKSVRYSTTFVFADTVKPSFVNFENKTAGVVALNFSEEIASTTVTTSNIKVFKDGVAQTVVNTATGTAGEILLVTTEKGFTLSGLENNVEYNVQANGLTDVSGNLTSPNLVNVTVKSTFEDKVVPVVSDITSAGLNKVVVKVSEELASTLNASGKKEYVTLAGVTADATADQVYNEKAGTVTVTITDTLTSNTLKTITVSTFKDLANNAGKAFSKTVNFSAVSAVAKTQVVSKLNGATPAVAADFLKVTFDKDITLAASTDLTATLTTKENVVKTITIPAANLSVGTDKETNVLYAELTGLAGLEEGTLKVTLAAATITTLDKNNDVTVNFVPSDANAPEVGSVSNITAQTVTVNFSKLMGQSALDVNNYTVDGVKVFESAVFKNDKQTVELTFKKGSVLVDGTFDFAVSTAVKAENGVAMKNVFSNQEGLKENVAPTVKSAKVASNGTAITVTFSEVVTDGSVDDKDFDVYVDGVKYSTATTTAGASSADVTLTLATALSAEALKGKITVQALGTIDIKDTNSNVTVVTSPVNVAN